MKTNASYAELVMIILVLAPLGYLGLQWNQLPAVIATHYGLNGQPDDWMPKKTAALFVEGISVLLYLVLRFLPKGVVLLSALIPVCILISIFGRKN